MPCPWRPRRSYPAAASRPLTAAWRSGAPPWQLHPGGDPRRPLRPHGARLERDTCSPGHWQSGPQRRPRSTGFWEYLSCDPGTDFTPHPELFPSCLLNSPTSPALIWVPACRVYDVGYSHAPASGPLTRCAGFHVDHGVVLQILQRHLLGALQLGIAVGALHEPGAPGQVLQPSVRLAVVLRGHSLRRTSGCRLIIMHIRLGLRVIMNPPPSANHNQRARTTIHGPTIHLSSLLQKTGIFKPWSMPWHRSNQSSCACIKP